MNNTKAIDKKTKTSKTSSAAKEMKSKSKLKGKPNQIVDKRYFLVLNESLYEVPKDGLSKIKASQAIPLYCIAVNIQKVLFIEDAKLGDSTFNGMKVIDGLINSIDYLSTRYPWLKDQCKMFIQSKEAQA